MHKQVRFGSGSPSSAIRCPRGGGKASSWQVTRPGSLDTTRYRPGGLLRAREVAFVCGSQGATGARCGGARGPLFRPSRMSVCAWRRTSLLTSLLAASLFAAIFISDAGMLGSRISFLELIAITSASIGQREFPPLDIQGAAVQLFTALPGPCCQQVSEWLSQTHTAHPRSRMSLIRDRPSHMLRTQYFVSSACSVIHLPTTAPAGHALRWSVQGHAVPASDAVDGLDPCYKRKLQSRSTSCEANQFTRWTNEPARLARCREPPRNGPTMRTA